MHLLILIVKFRMVMDKRRILFCCYRAFPNFSATALTLENLLGQLEPSIYRVVTKKYIGDPEASEPARRNYKESNRYISTVDTTVGHSRYNLRILRTLTDIPSTTKAILKEGRKFNCHQLLVVYPNFTFLGAAATAASKLKVPFDVWLHNTPQSVRGGRLFNDLLRLEQRYLHQARIVFALNEAMRDAYLRLYPKLRIEVMPHPFDAEPDERPPLDYTERPLRLLFTGACNASNEDALARIVETIRRDPQNFQLTVCTRMNREHFNRRFGIPENLNFKGFVTDAELETLHDKSHIFVLPHGLHGRMPDLEFKTIFPTKALGYMKANRPIMAHVAKDSGIAKFFRHHNCAALVEEATVNKIHAELLRIAENEAYREQLFVNMKGALANFDASVVAKRFLELTA